MTLLASFASNIRALSMEDPSQPLQPHSVLSDMLGMTSTNSGILVNEKTALRQPTVLACVRVKSLLGSLPLIVYQRTSNGKKRAIDHRLFSILKDEPNQQMSSMAMREGGEAQRQLWGNTYFEIQRDRAGRVVSIWPLPSDRTHAERKDGVLRYITTATPQGEPRAIAPENILHIPGMAFDGISGISPVQLGKETIGRAMAMERFGALFFGNGVRPSGAFVYSGGSLKDEQRANLKQTLKAAASRENAMNPLLLEAGLDWKPMSIPPDEAQFTESMKDIVADIARLFGVPLHLIQELSRATNNNIEQQALEFVMYGLRPDAIKWEQELNRKLFAGTDYFCEHSMEGLLRGDFKTRMEGWSHLFSTGAITPNFIAEIEGWNEIPDADGGNLRFVPLNMITLQGAKKQLDAPDQKLADGEGDGTPDDPNEGAAPGEQVPEDANAEMRRSRVVNGCKVLFRDAVNRTISRSKRDKETVAKIWRPALSVAAQMVSLCAVGAAKVTAATEQFTDGLAGDVWSRSNEWKSEDSDSITTQELNSAYEALEKHVLGGEQR